MTKYIATFTLFSICTIHSFLFAQDCNCAITLDSTITFADGDSYTYSAGDTICLGYGWRNHLQLRDWSGTPNNPIVFINCGGKVEIGNDNFYYGLTLANCSYFKLTGTGDPNHQYGIEMTGTGSGNAMSVYGISTDFEIEHLEVSGSDFAGIMCKQDPNCSTSTWRENFVMKNVSIHDTYIHNTGGEGMYLGYTFYTGKETTCNGETILVKGHEIENLNVYDNIIDSTGWDGIQVGSAPNNTAIFNNKITNYGLAKVGGQTSGIQIGGGTGGKCYNNFIKNGMGNGIVVFGVGGNLIYNNVIVNAGQTYYPNNPNQRVYGIFCNDIYTLPGKGFDFMNNTIVNPKTDGIRIYSTRSTNNKIYNNIIVSPGAFDIYENDNTSNVGTDAYVYAWADVDYVLSNNYFDTSLVAIQFADTTNNDYSLLPTSPAIDAGLNTNTFGILNDFRDSARGYGTAYDIGAYETPTTVDITGCMDVNAHNYNAKATVSSTCQTCFDGIQNGDETQIDCGGSKCNPCNNGCTDVNAHNYDAAAINDDGNCETCTDGIQNGDEERVDCGGSKCNPCPPLDCNCDFTLGNHIVRADGTTMGVQPGDTVCIESGERPYLRLENFIGSATDEIVFINCGGQAIVTNDFYKFDIQIEGSQYFKLTGSGDPAFTYGIKLDGTLTNSSLILANKTTDFEVEKIEILNSDFAGIMCKTDPTCDLSANRGNFEMNNVKIHDNYVHHTGGEGLYIGHSFYTGYSTYCSGVSTILYPHDIKNIEIYNNIIDSTGWDGMQVGCAVQNCKIYNNTITNFATKNETYQNVGLVIGAGTAGECYNNYIRKGKGSGLNLFGVGNNKVFNNVIADVDGIGIFADDRATTPNTRFYYLNNTIYNTGDDGFRIYSDETIENILINNLIVSPQTYTVYENDNTSLTGQDAFIRLANGVIGNLQNNHLTRWAATIHFVDSLNGDLMLQTSSPMINAGQDVSIYSINQDKNGTTRPQNGIFDIGAYEITQGLLPVELSHFQGYCDNEKVVLKWQTASERNNKGFFIELGLRNYKLGMIEWQEIGFITGNGTALNISDYVFYDENRGNETAYYRLRQVDFDGKTDYSNTISVECSPTINSFNIFPNPTKGLLNIQFAEPISTTIIVYDVLGRTVFEEVIEKSDTHTLQLNLDAGIYFLKIGTAIQKIVIK